MPVRAMSRTWRVPAARSFATSSPVRSLHWASFSTWRGTGRVEKSWRETGREELEGNREGGEKLEGAYSQHSKWACACASSLRVAHSSYDKLDTGRIFDFGGCDAAMVALLHSIDDPITESCTQDSAHRAMPGMLSMTTK